MEDDVAVRVEGVHKKYCRSLRRSMLYGLKDLGRNAVGMRSHSETLRKDEFWAVNDVSFDIKRGESVGLIGPNGSGKTTLLKMINGIFWPDRGAIAVRGRVGALIAVGAGFHPLLTGRENVYVNGAILGMSKAEVDRAYDSIVDFADIADFIDTPVKHYSSGMFVRLGFAVAVHSNPDVMLVDEVLAVGDRGFQTKCFKRMGELREKGTTFIVVAHNMHVIAGFCDWVALLQKGHMQRFDNMFEGIREYTRLFMGGDSDGIEKLIDGGEAIRFTDVKLTDREMNCGDAFRATLSFEAERDHEDVEVDIAVYDSRDPDLYHQATNHAHGTQVNLPKGKHVLEVEIESLPMNGSLGTVVVAIWAKNRVEQLFWWRIPVEVQGKDHSTGKNFLPVAFRVRD
ncbi:MAG: ABC transporter ATP-binding protein [Polyangiaceae bacterium]